MADTDPSNKANPSQQKICKGHKLSIPNYQNNKLIPTIERILPNSSDAWHLVAITYKEESGKNAIQTKEDLSVSESPLVRGC
jgi:hypothetical protein